ncbi:hypothetical protein BH18ACT15_BH18ACT15_15610 [soil metagenome]
MTTRARFLARIRERLGDAPRLNAPAIGGWSVSIDDAPARFAAELAAIDGIPHISTVGEAEAELASILAAAEEGPVLVAPEDGLPAGVEDTVTAASRELITWPGAGRDDWARAAVGMTSARWAIAETGSVVLFSGPTGARTTSLLPPVFVCMLPAERLVASTAEAFRLIAEAGTDSSSVIVVTGPSKSADIGNELAQGVHGPGEVHVILYGA